MYGVRMERSVIACFGLANINAVFAVGKNDAIRDGLERAIHGLLLRLGAVGERISKRSINCRLCSPGCQVRQIPHLPCLRS
jgi:hypothetical protein